MRCHVFEIGEAERRITKRQLAKDDDYVLQSVTVFKKVREEYVHKCRENKWVGDYSRSRAVIN